MEPDPVRAVLMFVLMMMFAALALDITIPALVLLAAVAAERVAFRLKWLSFEGAGR